MPELLTMIEDQTVDQDKGYILVVDECTEDRYYTSMLLRRFGFNVFAAHTTEKAIEFMTVAPPLAVIVAAESNGSLLLSWLKQDPRFFDVPLLLLSWWPAPTLSDKEHLGGFVASLRKPVNVMELYRVIQSAVEKSPRQNIRIASHLRVRLEDGPDSLDGFATVISEYGMFYRTLDPRPVASPIRVNIEIKGKHIQIETVVLYIIRFDEGPFKEPGMGMKFVTISRADRDLIASYILERVEEGLTRPMAPE
jgi:CheY-like chemotaxis protein